MITSLLRQVRADLLLYHRLRNPGRGATALALAETAARNPGFWIALGQRIGFFNFCVCRRYTPLWWLTRLLRVPARFYMANIFKSDFRIECELAPGVFLSNRGYLTIGAERVGSDSMIHDHCTFGYAITDNSDQAPRIGERVWVGPGCVVVGALTIGDGATLMPGAVVSFNVPPRTVVAGNPARIVRRDFDNAALRASPDVVYTTDAPVFAARAVAQGQD